MPPFDNDKALFAKDKSSKALRLLCEYIIFAFTGNEKPVNLGNLTQTIQWTLPKDVETIHDCVMADTAVMFAAKCYSRLHVAFSAALFCEGFYRMLPKVDKELVLVKSSVMLTSWITVFASSTVFIGPKITMTKLNEHIRNQHPDNYASIELGLGLFVQTTWYTKNNEVAFVLLKKEKQKTYYLLCLTCMSLFHDFRELRDYTDYFKEGKVLNLFDGSFGKQIKKMYSVVTPPKDTRCDIKQCNWQMIHRAIQYTLSANDKFEPVEDTRSFGLHTIKNAIELDKLFYK